MILATRKNGTRDGELLVVHRDRKRAVSARSLAPHLQHALDQWKTTQPLLQKLSSELNEEKAAGVFELDLKTLHAPLPRAYTWLDGSAFLSHVYLVRKSRGADIPESLLTDPLMYQGGSDSFLGPYDAVPLESEAWGIDLEAEIAVITDDVPMGTSAEKAEKHIQLLLLVNDVSLRVIAQQELQKNFGFIQSKPSTSFAPFALTPDELGNSWSQGRVHLPVESKVNSTQLGEPHAEAMHFSFGQLVAHAAKSRPLCAGSIIGSGTVSNEDTSRGYSCLVEKRMVEKLNTGASMTPFLRFGDTVTIDMKKNGVSLFGAIHQTITRYQPPT